MVLGVPVLKLFRVVLASEYVIRLSCVWLDVLLCILQTAASKSSNLVHIYIHMTATAASHNFSA